MVLGLVIVDQVHIMPTKLASQEKVVILMPQVLGIQEELIKTVKEDGLASDQPNVRTLRTLPEETVEPVVAVVLVAAEVLAELVV